jgi:hypothetical protein
MKRAYTIKVIGFAPFTMLIMEGEESPEDLCRAIFCERLEWVR